MEAAAFSVLVTISPKILVKMLKTIALAKINITAKGGHKPMKIPTRTLLFIMLLVSISLPSCTKRNAYDDLNDRIIVLFQQGQYSQAETLAQEALTIAKGTFGPSHLKVAGSLDTLAMIHYSQRKYEQAEPLYKEALAIVEKNRGPEHPDLAPVLENMANLYRAIGNEGESERLTERLNKIRSDH